MTRTQQSVLAVLHAEPTFLSAQEIHARVNSGAGGAGLASVYRAVQALAESGRIDVRHDPGGEARYRSCATKQHHHHLVCQACGETVEVSTPSMERWVHQVATRHGYAVVDHTLEILGTCARCS